MNHVFYVDDRYSGTNFDRPGFQKMLDDISDGKISTVITKALSRLGRNSTMVGMYTNVTFRKHDVRYIAVNVVLEKIVWEHIQKVVGLVSQYEEYFRSCMTDSLALQTKESIALLSKKMKKDKMRLEELNHFYIRLYEDNVTGKISDEKFTMGTHDELMRGSEKYRKLIELQNSFGWSKMA